jgi:repressor LexA|nr:MAG: CI repressor [Bacteriophage sp.]UVY56128.1 MAG: CI repressor [Bacteriophage sp.]UWF95454.1 MAG: CI repressor [Bacteriophage sp.]
MYRLEQLADLFDTTVAELMGETPEPVRPNGAQYVTLPVLVAGHAGEFTDEFGPDEVADVPISVLERVNDPDAYLMRVRGSCMNRRFADGENALLSPRCEPRNGDAVAAEYNGEMILRSYYRGASTLVLSPDSYEDGYTDIVFDDPENASVNFRGVVKWHQASEVKRY